MRGTFKQRTCKNCVYYKEVSPKTIGHFIRFQCGSAIFHTRSLGAVAEVCERYVDPADPPLDYVLGI